MKESEQQGQAGNGSWQEQLQGAYSQLKKEGADKDTQISAKKKRNFRKQLEKLGRRIDEINVHARAAEVVNEIIPNDPSIDRHTGYSTKEWERLTSLGDKSTVGPKKNDTISGTRPDMNNEKPDKSSASNSQKKSGVAKTSRKSGRPSKRELNKMYDQHVQYPTTYSSTAQEPQSGSWGDIHKEMRKKASPESATVGFALPDLDALSEKQRQTILGNWSKELDRTKEENGPFQKILALENGIRAIQAHMNNKKNEASNPNVAPESNPKAATESILRPEVRPGATSEASEDGSGSTAQPELNNDTDNVTDEELVDQLVKNMEGSRGVDASGEKSPQKKIDELKARIKRLDDREAARSQDGRTMQREAEVEELEAQILEQENILRSEEDTRKNEELKDNLNALIEEHKAEIEKIEDEERNSTNDGRTAEREARVMALEAAIEGIEQQRDRVGVEDTSLDTEDDKPGTDNLKDTGEEGEGAPDVEPVDSEKQMAPVGEPEVQSATFDDVRNEAGGAGATEGGSENPEVPNTPEGGERALNAIIERNTQANQESVKRGGFVERSVRSAGEWYNSLPPKWKMGLGVGLIAAGALAGFAGSKLALPVYIATVARRALATAGTFVAAEGYIEKARQKNEKWWNQYPKGMAALAAFTVGVLIPDVEKAKEVGESAASVIGGMETDLELLGENATPTTPTTPTTEAAVENIVPDTSPEDFATESTEYIVQSGDTTWDILEKDERVKEVLTQFDTPEQKAYALDMIQDKVASADLKAMGFENENIDLIFPGQDLNFDLVLDDEEFMQEVAKQTEALTPEQLEGIAKGMRAEEIKAMIAKEQAEIKAQAAAQGKTIPDTKFGVGSPEVLPWLDKEGEGGG